MDKNYSDVCRQISGNLRKLRKDIPDTMQAFSALAQAATRESALHGGTPQANRLEHECRGQNQVN